MFKKTIILFSLVMLILTGSGFAGDKIDINKATKAELSQLTGIGDKYAQRIIEYRQKNGKFNKIEDLLNIKGIGKKTLLKNKDKIIIGTKKTVKKVLTN
jgi:competence protein ComEA